MSHGMSVKFLFNPRSVVIVVMTTFLSFYLLIKYINRNYEETDNAVIKCEITDVLPEISGIINKLYFQDNQKVKTGQMLLQINDDIQRSNYSVLEANLAVQQSEIEKVKNSIKLEEIELDYETKQFERFRRLRATESVTEKELEDVGFMVNKIRHKIEILKDEMRSKKAQFNSAKARLEEAGVLLSKTSLISLRDGVVTNKRVFEGEYVAPGQTVASITSCDDKIWIEANYKETQIGKMKPGQKVDIHVDTYPGVILEGNIESISTGSGSTFSVLPPENASGNFTKVVQRFPVKININNNNDYELRLGMSVIVKVLVN